MLQELLLTNEIIHRCANFITIHVQTPSIPKKALYYIMDHN